MLDAPDGNQMALTGETTVMPSLPHARALAAAIALVATGLAAPALADAAAGAALFKTTCAICHSTVPQQTKIGPPLFGVVGRKAGTFPTFQYSDAMKKAGWIWDEAKLAIYIDNPPKTANSSPCRRCSKVI